MKKLLIFLASFALFVQLQAQERRDKVPVTFEELYDEPYAINKLFVHFQPVYGELWKTNINAGFGLEATYFMKDKFTFRAHARKSYSQKFDLSRDLAERNNDMEDEPNIFNLYEFGATYHIKDYTKSSTTKMVLYKKSYKDAKWAARVPLNAEVPATLRKIFGARLGGLIYDSSVDLRSAIEDQGGSIEEFVNAEGNPLPLTLPDVNGEPRDTYVYGNMNAAGLYLGTSLTWIRNVAVDFDNNYQDAVDDLILTAFFDLLIMPSMNVDDLTYLGEVYSTEAFGMSKVGFRLGLEGKFNRTLSWAYGGEIGMRPGPKKRGLYAAIKVSFPVYSTNIDYNVQAFGK